MRPGGNVLNFSRKGSTCGDCPRHQRCAWRDLDLEEGDSNTPAVTLRLFHRGDAVFHAGERLDALYLLRSGAVKTTVGSEDGEEQIVGFHVAGDILGLDAIAAGNFVSTATVLDTSSVCVLSREAYRAALATPSVQEAFLDMMSHIIRRYEQSLLMLGKLNAEQRLAAFLLEQLEAAQRRGLSGTSLTLPMSRADIAGYLSLAPETVSRVLTRMQSGGMLEVDRNHVEVLDAERLREAAGRARLTESGDADVRAMH